MHVKAWLSAIVLSAVLSAPALAYSPSTPLSPSLRCDNCAVSEMKAMAIAKANSTGDYNTPVYVVNIPADAMLKYTFERIWVLPDRENGIPGYRYTEAHEVAPEASVSSFVSILHKAWSGPAVTTSNMPGGLPDSVYTDITYSGLHYNLQQYLQSNIHPHQRLVQDMYALIQSLSFSTFDTGMFQLEITYRFPDGSIAQYRYDRTTGKWERVAGTEMDSEGNFVPSRIEDFSNPNGSRRDFNFDTTRWNNNYNNFLEMARIYGIPVTAGSGTRIRIACVKVGGGAWECHTS